MHPFTISHRRCHGSGYTRGLEAELLRVERQRALRSSRIRVSKSNAPRNESTISNLVAITSGETHLRHSVTSTRLLAAITAFKEVTEISGDRSLKSRDGRQEDFSL